MDTPNKNWSDLTARARTDTPPVIDVRAAVRRSITTPVLQQAPAPMFSGGWLTASLTAFTMLAVIFSYIGINASTELSFALGFSSTF